MSGDDLQRMAQDAGLVYGYPFTWKNLEDFAALVAAKEREACAKECEAATESWAPNHYNDGCIFCAKAIRAMDDDAYKSSANVENVRQDVHDWPVTKQTLGG